MIFMYRFLSYIFNIYINENHIWRKQGLPAGAVRAVGAAQLRQSFVVGARDLPIYDLDPHVGSGGLSGIVGAGMVCVDRHIE